MKWVIKNPAPLDSRQEKWGDFHFGRSLTKYLERLGEEVITDYDGEWENDHQEDVVLVLRGKYPYKVKKEVINIMWNISHPADVSMEEYSSYDLVLVASNSFSEKLKKDLSIPVEPLLQCTDTEEFKPSNLDHFIRKDFVFVGNTRSVKRPGVLWSVDLGLPLKVWGRGWKEYIPKSHIVADYIENQQLGELYAQSKVIINDHWDDMKEFGFIN
ncbi:MAG: hypothetical protein RLO81_19225, partial [Fulvivirga sp.]|uniref:hypothetical protein n=1 Tax=Fulvivirga sp. TaxID=1931237 RepID=UPI0032EB709C